MARTLTAKTLTTLDSRHQVIRYKDRVCMGKRRTKKTYEVVEVLGDYVRLDHKDDINRFFGKMLTKVSQK